MTVSDKFFFIAGTPALDFVNTEKVSEGERVDLLTSADDVLEWLVAAGLASTKKLPYRESLLREARALRAELRALAEKTTVRAADLAKLDVALARGRGRLSVRPEQGRVHLEFTTEADDPLFLIARAAAEFFSSAEPSYIRQCEGSGCILFFYDTTKSHSRRWCSMAGCGNRMKAAAHYQRKKSGG
ncbi:MAG TPA: ABATE domain-containing protein [Thermoanaerobaculia bacterium]